VPSRKNVDQMLAEARDRIERLSPEEARRAMDRGAVVVDIRADSQRERDGTIPGAAHVPRNVLEWRLDPKSGARDPELASYDREVAVICDEGYQSSLAAAVLRDLGIERATDVVGGFQAWRAAGLPVTPPPARSGR
jgi:rhodanese-related sulfurtransferase